MYMYIWNQRAVEIYTADIVYKRLMKKSKSVSLDHNDGRPISIWRPVNKFKDHNV
jgi:hypothetical protein